MRKTLTLLSSQQPLDAFDEFMTVSVSTDADLLEFLMTHIGQHVQSDLMDTALKTRGNLETSFQKMSLSKMSLSISPVLSQRCP